MRQRRICVLLILVALLLPGCAKAGPQPHEHTWENRKCVTCGEEKEVHRLGNWAYVLWEETGTMEMVSFPENAEEVPFRELPDGISIVQIADGITDIPDSAFWGCETLVDVALPQTLRTIGKGAFGQCVNLTRINIPEGVTSIGDSAFLMCGSLTRLTIPDSVTSIEGNPFRHLAAEIMVSSQNPAISVVDGVVFNKDGTRLIACPSNKAGAYAIPQGVLEIGTHAFENCNDLTDVTIPASVASIVGNPFDFAQLELKLAPENPDFSLIDGVLFDQTGTKLLVYPCGRPGDTCEVPEGTVEIGEFAFAGCQQLSAVTIPESVTVIGSNSFWNCENLRLYVWDGSYAQRYAREHRMDFFEVLPDMGPEIDASDVLE